MAYKIDKGKCINSGECQEVCPVDCISEVDGKREIDADECIDCGACADVCPVSCIKPE